MSKRFADFQAHNRPTRPMKHGGAASLCHSGCKYRQLFICVVRTFVVFSSLRLPVTGKDRRTDWVAGTDESIRRYSIRLVSFVHFM
jgi:hypothetical protein